MTWWSELVEGSYPPPNIFDFDGQITHSELRRFVRIIMTEGVPFACTKYPMAFEFARGRAANELGLDSKQVSLVGSARIGYSMAAKKFGQPFNLDTSDIDLFAVDEELFNCAVSEYWNFIKAWENNSIHPRHPVMREYWESSRKYDPSNIRRGFLDATHIPTWDQFPIARKVEQAAYLFHINLEAKVGRKIGKKASIRVYRDWDSAFRQITLTIESALERLRS